MFEVPDELFIEEKMPAEWAEKLNEYLDGVYFEEGEKVGPKYDNVAAAILSTWAGDTSNFDEECGTSEFGNGWHALFRSERAVLGTDSQGFVYAWRVSPDEDLDKKWAEIEAGAVYPDSPDF